MMEPTPFHDIRTIWFGNDSPGPNGVTDYEILLERHFDQVVDRSITHFPNLWGLEEGNDADERQSRARSMYNFLPPPRSKKEYVVGHYCIIKPLPEFMRGCVRETFEPYGHIVETKIVKSKLDGISMGIADFKEEKHAIRAAASINGSDLGGGIVLSCRYLRKQKRSKTLDQLAERQLRQPVERKKHPVVAKKLSNSETRILASLCQQWSSFAEMNGAMPLNELIWTLSSNRAPLVPIMHKPKAPAAKPMTDEIRKVLAELEEETQSTAC